MVQGFPFIAEFWLAGYEVEGRMSAVDIGEVDDYEFHVAGEGFAHTGALHVIQAEEEHDASENVFTLLTIQDAGHILLPSPHTVVPGLYAPVWRLPSEEVVSLILSHFSTAGNSWMIPEMAPSHAWENSAVIMQHLREQHGW